jgi:hypothetical protein
MLILYLKTNVCTFIFNAFNLEQTMQSSFSQLIKVISNFIVFLHTKSKSLGFLGLNIKLKTLLTVALRRLNKNNSTKTISQFTRLLYYP